MYYILRKTDNTEFGSLNKSQRFSYMCYHFDNVIQNSV